MTTDKKEQINHLIVQTLQKTNSLTARDIYVQIWQEHPTLVRKGFRNFVTVLRTNENVKPVQVIKGKGLNYMLLR